MYRDENEAKIERLIELKERDRKRLEELRRIHKDELIAREQKDKALQEVFEKRRKYIENEEKKQKIMTKIMFYFEDWYEKKGQFVKIKKKKKGKKK